MLPKTVFVVGAGASHEVGLPIGKTLKSKIADRLDVYFDGWQQQRGDAECWEALQVDAKHSGVSAKFYQGAARRIAAAMPLAVSIDNFIDNHAEDDEITTCGKVAIVHSILAEEGACRLAFDHTATQHFDFATVADTWFNKFWQLLTIGTTLKSLRDRFKSVAIITFNYDRCIEQFLFHAAQKHWGCDAQEAASLLADLSIYHAYGSVGSLPWQRRENPTEFGAERLGSQRLLSCADNIKTFTEKYDADSADLRSIRNSIQEATQIVFLGFAFHDDNMRLLGSGYEVALQQPDTRYFATALGISDSDCEDVKQVLRKMKRHEHPLADASLNVNNRLTCSGLFDAYWRGLSLARQ